MPNSGHPGGSGGGRALGPRQNTFGDDSTADRPAAEALRDAYAGANAGWLAQYNGNRSFLILLQWDDGDVVQRRNVAGDAWEDVTDVIQGPRGVQGPAADGLRTYSAVLTYDAAANTIELAAMDLGGGMFPTGKASLVYGFLPRDVDRGSVDLSTRGHGLNGEWRHVNGSRIKARDLTPGALASMLVSAVGGHVYFIEPLPRRPQDYVIAVVLGEDENDDALAAADLSTARAAFSTATGNVIDVQAARTAAGVTNSDRNRYTWFGVPADAPDLAGFTARATEAEALELTSGAALSVDDRYTDVEPQHNGVPYKWWRRRQSWTSSRLWLALFHRSY